MSRDLRKKAKELSSHGRNGDSTLLHVHPAEVAGLESLVPGGKLPRNPKTGLPEAFFFLPFLAAAAPAAAAAGTAAAALPAITAATTGAAALGGAAAGLGAAGAAGAGAAGLGALGAAALPTAAETAGALGAAGGAATGLAAGAPAAALAAPEVAGAGIGSLAPAAGVDAMTTGSIGAGAAGALPATAPIPTASPLAAGGANSLVGGGAGMSSAPSVIAPSAAPAAAGPVAGPLSPSTGALSSPAAGVTAPMGTGAATPLTSGAPMASATGAAGKGGLSGLMGSLGNMDLMKLAPLAMLMPRGGGGDDDDGKSKKKISGDYKGPDASFPGSDYQGGIDPEWNYFPHYNNGGMVQRYAGGGIVGLGAPSVMNQSPAMMQGQAMPQAPQGGIMNSALGGGGPTAPLPAGGGGIAQLMQPPAMSAPPAQIDSPYAEPSGAPKTKGGKSDEELIAATVEALQGKSPNPQAVLTAFIKTFGQNALQDLVQRMQTSNQQEAAAKGIGGMAGAMGDGQSDNVPGLIDGNQPAALSSGEYVVPSDVVSHLGNGSTDAGAQQLDGMVGRTRMARGGAVGQPPSINPRGMMPT